MFSGLSSEWLALRNIAGVGIVNRRRAPESLVARG